jgi:DNA-binding MarR family transcriptional regulator
MTETSTRVTALDQTAGYHLFRLGRDVAQLLERTLEPIGLRPRELRLLSFVAAAPLSQRELGQRADLDRTTVVAEIDRLEEAELVTRERDETDRRKYLITPTDRGRTVYRTAMRRLATAEEEYLSVLATRQRADFRRSLSTLYASRTVDC